jgi:AcrR family transcriptional regulator
MGSSQPPGGPPALRADAQRNLERVLAAAREVFLEEGVDGSVEEIARRAGVGVGTIYRRFPRKEDLVEAIISEHFAALVAIVRGQLDAADPWEGFAGMLHETLERFATNRGFKAVMSAQWAVGPPKDLVDEVVVLSDRVVRRAQDAGVLRPDFDAGDMPSIYHAVSAVMADTEATDPRQWERFLAMVLDGLRTSAATPLPVGPLTVAERQHAFEDGPSACAADR